MNKKLKYMISGVLALGLIGCGSSNSTTEKDVAQTAEPTAAVTAQATPEVLTMNQDTVAEIKQAYEKVITDAASGNSVFSLADQLFPETKDQLQGTDYMSYFFADLNDDGIPELFLQKAYVYPRYVESFGNGTLVYTIQQEGDKIVATGVGDEFLALTVFINEDMNELYTSCLTESYEINDAVLAEFSKLTIENGRLVSGRGVVSFDDPMFNGWYMLDPFYDHKIIDGSFVDSDVRTAVTDLSGLDRLDQFVK